MADTPTPSRETVSDLLQVVTNDPSYGTFVPPPVHETAAVACSRLSDLQDKELRFLAVGLKNQRNPSTYQHRWKALHEYLVTLFHMERADENLMYVYEALDLIAQCGGWRNVVSWSCYDEAY